MSCIVQHLSILPTTLPEDLLALEPLQSFFTTDNLSLSSPNTRKPAGELYSAFKKSFPHVGPGTIPGATAPVTSSEESTATATTDTMDSMLDQRYDNRSHEFPPSFLGSALFLRCELTRRLSGICHSCVVTVQRI